MEVLTATLNRLVDHRDRLCGLLEMGAPVESELAICNASIDTHVSMLRAMLNEESVSDTVETEIDDIDMVMDTVMDNAVTEVSG